MSGLIAHLEARYGAWHRRFCETYVEKSRWAQFLDARLPLELQEVGVFSRKAASAGVEGLRILHVSDLHFDGTPALVRRLASVVQGLSVDLVALTGDYSKGQSTGEDCELVTAQIAEALGGVSSRFGIFATLGNHDHPRLQDSFRRAGIETLTRHTLRVGGAQSRLLVSGYDPFHAASPESEEATKLRSVDVEDFGIMLCHVPAFAASAASCGYGLYLAGHTHGPQMPISALKRFAGGERASGLWREGSMTGHTSTGVGTSLWPVRIGQKGRASVTILTLKAS